MVISYHFQELYTKYTMAPMGYLYISNMYLPFLNTKVQKNHLFIKRQQKIVFVTRLFVVMLFLSLGGVIGLWVFVAKVNKLHIFFRQWSSLSWSDLIQVLGVARQFAVLYSMNDGMDCFKYACSHYILINIDIVT